MRRELVCSAAPAGSRFQTRVAELKPPDNDDVLVRVSAASVNPIDVKRAQGYGRRLLALKGVKYPDAVLGNDLAGVVDTVGRRAAGFAPGQRVYGLVNTGKRGGSHASHVIVPSSQLLLAPEPFDAMQLTALPYSFTTVWLALHGIGLDAGNSVQKRILINGASGGLGQLALQLLRLWQCDVTAICGPARQEAVRLHGPSQVVLRAPGAIEGLPAHFDGVLNFGNWDDDPALASRLNARALGHATTVHPLLANFDAGTWLGGAWNNYRAWKAMRRHVAEQAPAARYAWTVFRPSAAALNALGSLVQAKQISLPIGIAVPFEKAQAAFEHVRSEIPGRAILLP